MALQCSWLVSIGRYRCLSELECKGKHRLCADCSGVIGVEVDDWVGDGVERAHERNWEREHEEKS